MDELLLGRKIEMFKDHRRQQRGTSSAADLPHDSAQRGPPDPEPATLVAEEIPPSTCARGASAAIASIRNGSCARNDNDTWRVTGTGNECDKRVVDNDHLGLEADSAHDALHRGGVVRSIDPSDAQADGRWPQVVLTDRGVHHLMKDLLDLEFAGSLQVRASATRLADNSPLTVGKQTHRFCAARIYSEDVHL